MIRDGYLEAPYTSAGERDQEQKAGENAKTIDSIN